MEGVRVDSRASSAIFPLKSLRFRLRKFDAYDLEELLAPPETSTRTLKTSELSLRPLTAP